MNDDDRIKREREVSRGQSAAQITQHPLWDESWQTLEADLLRMWRNSKPSDKEGRENCYAMLVLALKARAHIESVLTTGQLARKQLETVTNG